MLQLLPSSQTISSSLRPGRVCTGLQKNKKVPCRRLPMTQSCTHSDSTARHGKLILVRWAQPRRSPHHHGPFPAIVLTMQSLRYACRISVLHALLSISGASCGSQSTDVKAQRGNRRGNLQRIYLHVSCQQSDATCLQLLQCLGPCLRACF
jgi:hypothetical protein